MKKVKVMGIVNVTPDSFSDGGKFYRPEEAVKRAKNLIAEGADIIDIGGESTRPGATPIAWEEEWARIEPVLSQLVPAFQPSNLPLVSVDTYHLDTAERAIALGAGMINCVKPEMIPEMLQLAVRHPNLELVLPCRLKDNWVLDCADWALVGNRVYLDPMVGFDTSREEDMGLLRDVAELTAYGKVAVGASRKRIVKRLTGEKAPGKDLAGNLAIAMWAAMNGASLVRVHDVRETVQAFKVLEVLRP